MKTWKLLSLAVVLSGVLACNSSSSSRGGDHAKIGVDAKKASDVTISSKGDVLAELNGEKITSETINKMVEGRLAQAEKDFEKQVYQIKRSAIDSYIDEKLLTEEAKKRNLSIEELFKKEVHEKVGEVTEKEIKEFYDKNKIQKPYEEIKAAIAAQIKRDRMTKYRNNFMDRISSHAKVEVYLQRPVVEVGHGNGPTKGPEKAAISLIEFTDYECPYCGKARDSIKQVLDKYGSKVRYTVRNFPLHFHAHAKKAAMAALCANEQNKYWEFAQKMWENQGSIDVPDLKKHAADLKLDTQKFDACLDSDKYQSEIAKDMADASKVGVTGTPAFFINGKMINGALPFESFQEIIEEELKEAKK